MRDGREVKAAQVARSESQNEQLTRRAIETSKTRNCQRGVDPWIGPQEAESPHLLEHRVSECARKQKCGSVGGQMR